MHVFSLYVSYIVRAVGGFEMFHVVLWVDFRYMIIICEKYGDVCCELMKNVTTCKYGEISAEQDEVHTSANTTLQVELAFTFMEFPRTTWWHVG